MHRHAMRTTEREISMDNRILGQCIIDGTLALCAHVFVFNISHQIFHHTIAILVWVCSVHYTHFRSSDPIDSISSGFIYLSCDSDWVSEANEITWRRNRREVNTKKTIRTQLAIDKNSQGINKSFSVSCLLILHSLILLINSMGLNFNLELLVQ